MVMSCRRSRIIGDGGEAVLPDAKPSRLMFDGLAETGLARPAGKPEDAVKRGKGRSRIVPIGL
jgi:hypothetical protein